MNFTELALHFPSSTEVNVSFGGADSGMLAFANPVTPKDRADIRWYVETYGARSLDVPDDQEASRIKARLPQLGKALFSAVFDDRAAQRLFDRFQDASDHQRVLTINTQDAAILALPWELLHDPTGTFLFREKPHISVRRKISGATGGRAPFRVDTKDRLHLLFVVSRPADAGFIDPRADPQAVLDALEKHAPGRVTWEFLLPATLNALVERLDDDAKPSVDILHFDGHGVFAQVSEEDADNDPNLFGKSIVSEIHRERQLRGDATATGRVGIGFLVFEKEDGGKHLIPAEDLADNLYRSKVGLVVLSACQTAALDVEGDPMASVAGRLTTTGIPAILAMTHAVLVPTTRMLFGKFYESLARGRGIATALDDARIHLANNPGKYEVRRGDRRQMLELDDWFLPALFHGGADVPLLESATGSGSSQAGRSVSAAPIPARHNLRAPHEAGFFGRRRELWDIACWFAGAETRRISLTGFGGQGKTELALEAGRWLVRTGRFERAVFLDYSRVQAEDACSVAVSAISSVLDRSLIDAAAATLALAEIPTLVILDNLEAVAPAALKELLDAAIDWSCAGDSRVLLTSRTPDFGHPGYRIEGTLIHRRIGLEGLGAAAWPEDALAWFGELSKLPPAASVPPPKRDELILLFDRVAFHPLSICVLAQQLKSRSARKLDERLQQILGEAATSGIALEGTPQSLIASLQLSLERLTERERHAVRRLGVFHGCAFEDDLLVITQLGAQKADPAGKAEENIWPGLRRQLESAALIEAEDVPGVDPPFLRFHPTLAPMLWAGLATDERDALTAAHIARYHSVASDLYNQDAKNPHQARAIARRNLPNLLHGVDVALETGHASAVDFVDSINRFLSAFGMRREAARLTRRAEQASGERGSEAWYLTQSSHGDQLRTSGRVGEAEKIFIDMMATLGDQPSFRHAMVLGRLGRCYMAGGRSDLAEATYRQGIAVIEQLESSDNVRRHQGFLRTDLADALRTQGRYPEAREQYKLGLEPAKQLDDPRAQGVTLGQLGTLALEERDLEAAEELHREALALFQRLGEPEMEAVAQHQLGNTFGQAGQWEKAEQHFREAARLWEDQGNLSKAAQSWSQLATVNGAGGRHEAASTWFRKAIDVLQTSGDKLAITVTLSNFSAFLRTRPGRLDEAREVAEQCLAIGKTLDPDAAGIWTIYAILADIADQQSQTDRGTEYRRLAREAKRNFAGTAHEMKRHRRIIFETLAAVQDPAEAEKFHTVLLTMEGLGWIKLVAALRLIVAGERDEIVLLASVDTEDSMIIDTILRAIDDPGTLSALELSEGAE